MKTKILNLIIPAIFLFVGFTSYASDYWFQFKLLSEKDRTIAVSGLHTTVDKYNGSIEIPQKYTESGITYRVVKIQSLRLDNKYITEIIIPKSITEIGSYAFDDCKSLTSITIPTSVTKIGDMAFRGCDKLTSITIPRSVSDLSNIGGDNLTEILVDKNNEHYTSVNGVVYTKDMTQIITYPQKHPEKDFTIPNSVTQIGKNAFFGCSELTSITIPNSITKIGNSAFSNCSGLTSITIPNSVTEIEDYAFYLCSELTSITIPNSVTKIGRYAFHHCYRLSSITIPNSVTKIEGSTFSCSGLTSITIPNSVTEIEDYAFYDCPLTSITIPNSVTQIGNSALHSCKKLESIYMLGNTPPNVDGDDVADLDIYKKTTLYVPIGCIKAYENVPQWNDFWNIEEMDFSGIDDIHETPNMHITVENGSIIIDNENRCEVKIYSTNGRLVYSGTNGRIDNLQHGIYIIHIGDKVTKVAI